MAGADLTRVGDPQIGQCEARGRGGLARNGPAASISAIRSGVAAPGDKSASTRSGRGPSRCPRPCRARSSDSRAIAGSSCAAAEAETLLPSCGRRRVRSAPRRPASGSRRPDRRPGPTGPSPCPDRPSKPITTDGRSMASLSRAATMPTTPGMPARRLRPRPGRGRSAASACSRAATRTLSSMSRRSVLSRSSCLRQAPPPRPDHPSTGTARPDRPCRCDRPH